MCGRYGGIAEPEAEGAPPSIVAPRRAVAGGGGGGGGTCPDGGGGTCPGVAMIMLLRTFFHLRSRFPRPRLSPPIAAIAVLACVSAARQVEEQLLAERDLSRTHACKSLVGEAAPPL
eukprot:CAMPEP_0119481956 /NCGR_PEP_ID=MMETSP1344-20130328/10041_1 /TAXON_ID=236787 /ORGANISM="Florenciella parvula, Strain CCMP2471" /LENGTH=116 /DNA_ID=CAMNT_0007516339 /DNA_START=1329 /DNA_END=1678 /DNA_ORIENTATION=-